MTPDTRIYVAGHRGLAGSALVRVLQRQRATRTSSPARTRSSISLDARAVAALLPGRTARGRVPRRRQGRRHPRQQHLSGRVHPRQPRHPDQRDPRGLARRRAAAALPRLVVHLPARLPAADPRGLPADRAARAHQPRLTRSPRSPASRCAGPTTASTARNTSARCRPISTAPATTTISQTSHVLPALIRRFHEAKARGDKTRHALGHRHAAPRVPLQRRHGRRVRAPDGAAAGAARDPRQRPRAAARQRRLRRGPHDPRARGARPQRSSAPMLRSSGTARSRTARRASCSTSASSRRSAGGRRSRWTTASGARTPTTRPIRAPSRRLAIQFDLAPAATHSSAAPLARGLRCRGWCADACYGSSARRASSCVRQQRRQRSMAIGLS